MALLLLSGCTLLGDSGSENVVPTLTEGTFEEDFSDPDAAWREESAGELRFQFQEGGYVVSAAAGRSAFVTARRYPAESRVAVETSFARIRDDSDERGGIFAVACQHFAGPEGLNSYAGVVQVSGGKGYPGLISWRDGEGHALFPLSAPAATFDPAAVNTLALTCSPGRRTGELDLDLALNGQVVAHATDRNAAAPPALVEAGLYVDTSPLHGDERFAIRFDDFSISLR